VLELIRTQSFLNVSNFRPTMRNPGEVPVEAHSVIRLRHTVANFSRLKLHSSMGKDIDAQFAATDL